MAMTVEKTVTKVETNPIIGLVVGVVVGVVVGYIYELSGFMSDEEIEIPVIGLVKVQTLFFTLLSIAIAIYGLSSKKKGLVTVAVGIWIGGYVADTQW